MLYKEYLNAARKHEYTCDAINEKISLNNSSTMQQKSLLLNLYYLSGFVIECITKYAIYDLVKHKRDLDVKVLNNSGLTYDLHIKHHRFDRYTDHLNRLLSIPIPLISFTKDIEKEVLRLYKEWDVDIRYRYDLVMEQSYYQSFYKYSKKIFRLIRDNVWG
jgi:hypothetical protein